MKQNNLLQFVMGLKLYLLDYKDYFIKKIGIPYYIHLMLHASSLPQYETIELEYISQSFT